MASVSSLAFVLALSTVADVQLLFFTSQTCVPCQQAKPVVSQLVSQGYPIVTVDITQQAQLADRFQIQQIPCFVLVIDGQEVRRVLGAQPAQVLAGMIEGAQGQLAPNRSAPSTQATLAENGAPDQRVAAPPRASPAGGQPSGGQAVDEYNGWRDGIGYVATNNASAAQQRALAATVRLHVDENNATAVGSGTVIHQQGDSALVLTCGHLFREAGKSASVKAEIGFPNSPRQYDARVLFYDAEDHDVALVVVRVSQPLTVAKLAPAQFQPRVGDQVFGVGCGGGDDPSVLGTRIKALTNYSGINKYDTFTRPEQGRSGGGLFSAGGQLIGICNAAAVNVDEGIYAGLESIYMVLQANNLVDVVTAPAADSFANARTATPRSAPRLAAAANQNARTEAVSQPIPPRGETPPVAVPVSTNPPVRSPAIGAGSNVEIILVVRSLDDPTQTETIVVKDPSPELLQQIAQASGNAAAQGEQVLAERWQTVAPRTANVRAQSPN